MATITVLTEPQLRAAVGLSQVALDAVRAVYPIISAGKASMPPIMRIDVPEHGGEIDVKSAYLPGYDGIAVKLSTGYFANPDRGLPSLSGLMVLLDAQTGLTRAALFDNGYLTDLRTALAGAVAADALAVPEASIVAIVGAGVQARLQLQALQLVRTITAVRVWARRPAAAAAFAKEMGALLGISVEPVGSVIGAASDADVLVTTTPATQPVVPVEALHPGLHVTAVGSDTEHKQELDVKVLRVADVVVVDRLSQSRILGELRAAIADGFDASAVVELGEVIAGRAAGRTSAGAITVCDLTGTGAQDTAIATLAAARCHEAGTGLTVGV
ncbi:ectoine utilization protein EutC [soil metagenome]